MAFSCLALNLVYSSPVTKSGGKGSVVVSTEDFKTWILLFNFSTVIGFESNESKAAPFATRRWASSGTIISSSFKFSVSINLFLSSGK